MIVSFEQAPTAQALEELAGSLADRPEAIEAPELVGAFAAWIMHVLTQRFGGAGRELRRKLRAEEEGTMSTLIERARKWGEERDRQLMRRQVSRRFGPGTAEQLMPPSVRTGGVGFIQLSLASSWSTSATVSWAFTGRGPWVGVECHA